MPLAPAPVDGILHAPQLVEKNTADNQFMRGKLTPDKVLG